LLGSVGQILPDGVVFTNPVGTRRWHVLPKWTFWKLAQGRTGPSTC